MNYAFLPLFHKLWSWFNFARLGVPVMRFSWCGKFANMITVCELRIHQFHSAVESKCLCSGTDACLLKRALLSRWHHWKQPCVIPQYYSARNSVMYCILYLYCILYQLLTMSRISICGFLLMNKSRPAETTSIQTLFIYGVILMLQLIIYYIILATSKCAFEIYKQGTEKPRYRRRCMWKTIQQQKWCVQRDW